MSGLSEHQKKLGETNEAVGGTAASNLLRAAYPGLCIQEKRKDSLGVTCVFVKSTCE